MLILSKSKKTRRAHDGRPVLARTGRTPLIFAISMLAVLLGTSGCTPSVTGATGVFMSSSGHISGVVQVCTGTVTSFGVSAPDGSVEWADFDRPVTGNRVLTLETELLDSNSNLKAFGGTPGKANATALLEFSLSDVSSLPKGGVLYSTIDEDGLLTQRIAADMRSFESTACRDF